MVVRTISGFLLSFFMAVPPLAADTSQNNADSRHGLSGIASVYTHEGGERTASGEKTVPDGFTAAHRTLPMNTRVKVTNRNTGRAVTVRINDRGPFVKGRVIDLTPRAAQELGFDGLAPVEITVLD